MGKKETVEQAILCVRDNLTYLIRQNNYLETHNNIERKIAQVISLKSLEEESQDIQIYSNKNVLVNIRRVYVSYEKQYSKEYDLVIHFPEDEAGKYHPDCISAIAVVKQIDSKYVPINGKLVLVRK